MSATIQIYGDQVDSLSVTLFDVLSHVKNGHEYNWGILWLDAIGDLEGESMLKLEDEINNSTHGLLVNWENLLGLSKNFHQVQEILLVGDRDASNIGRFESEILYSKCFYTIELIDSSYWIVHAQDEAAIADMISNFKGVKKL